MIYQFNLRAQALQARALRARALRARALQAQALRVRALLLWEQGLHLQHLLAPLPPREYHEWPPPHLEGESALRGSRQ